MILSRTDKRVSDEDRKEGDMVQIERLKREIGAQGFSTAQVAWHLGMSEQCFLRRLDAGRFGTQDILLLTELLGLQCPEDIFFI